MAAIPGVLGPGPPGACGCARVWGDSGGSWQPRPRCQRQGSRRSRRGQGAPWRGWSPQGSLSLSSAPAGRGCLGGEKKRGGKKGDIGQKWKKRSYLVLSSECHPHTPVPPHMPRGSRFGISLDRAGDTGTRLAPGPFTQDHPRCQDTPSPRTPPLPRPAQPPPPAPGHPGPPPSSLLSITCRPLPSCDPPAGAPPAMGTFPSALGPPGPRPGRPQPPQGPPPAPVTPDPTSSRLHLQWCRRPRPSADAPVSLLPSLTQCRYHRCSITVPVPVPVSVSVAGIAVPVSRAAVSVSEQAALWPCPCGRAAVAGPGPVPPFRGAAVRGPGVSGPGAGAGPAPPAAAPRGHVCARTCLGPGPAPPRSHWPLRPRGPAPFLLLARAAAPR